MRAAGVLWRCPFAGPAILTHSQLMEIKLEQGQRVLSFARSLASRLGEAVELTLTAARFCLSLERTLRRNPFELLINVRLRKWPKSRRPSEPLPMFT